MQKISKLRWASVPPAWGFFFSAEYFIGSTILNILKHYMSMFTIRTRPFKQIVDDVILYYIIGNQLSDSFEISDLIQLYMVII